MKEFKLRILTSILLIFILYFAYIYDLIFILLLSIISILSYYEFLQLLKKIKNKTATLIIFSSLGLLYLVLTVYFLYIKIFELKNIIFYFILICIASDIGGLLAGKFLKGRKLTKISPNKTYSGFFGSFGLAFLIMLLLINNLQINLFILVLFTFSVCFLSQLGDLFFSFLKRKAKVKDTGKLLPGHGGMLDRVDGIIISVPINIFFYSL